MASEFSIAIVCDTGAPVLLRPGSIGERDLVASMTNAIVAKGVGFFRTQSQVERAIREGISEAIFDLKAEVEST